MGERKRTMRASLVRAMTNRVRTAAHPRPGMTLRSPMMAQQYRFNQQAAMESHKFDDLDAHRRRLIYRSKQRGWLELGIMLGEWSSANLARMTPTELEEYENILDLENPDLFKWLTLQEPVPDDLQGPVFAQLINHMNDDKMSMAAAETRTTEEWSSRKWWTEEISDEMKENQAKRDAARAEG